MTTRHHIERQLEPARSRSEEQRSAVAPPSDLLVRLVHALARGAALEALRSDEVAQGHSQLIDPASPRAIPAEVRLAHREGGGGASTARSRTRSA